MALRFARTYDRRSARDRHDRAAGRLLLHSPVPGRHTRAHLFEMVASRVMTKIQRNAHGQLDNVRLTIDYVPPDSPDVCHAFTATRSAPATIVIYYIPLSRMTETSLWADLLGDVIAEQAAQLCSFSTDNLWPT